MSQWVMHRDPRYFDEPERFKPERWAAGVAGRLPKYAYFPFGGGQRMCIGSFVCDDGSGLAAGNHRPALSLAARAGPYGGAGPFDHLAPQAWRQGHAAAAVNPALPGSSRERAPDPDKTSEYTSNGVNNHFMYSNPEVDKLMEDGKAESDTKKRIEIYNRIQKLVYDDLPVIWVC